MLFMLKRLCNLAKQKKIMKNLTIKYGKQYTTNNKYYFVVTCENNKIWRVSESIRKCENFIKKIK